MGDVQPIDQARRCVCGRRTVDLSQAGIAFKGQLFHGAKLVTASVTIIVKCPCGVECHEADRAHFFQALE